MPSPYEIIYEFIQDDVKRPDLEDEINRRIQRAVQRYHRMDMWMKDHVDQVYVFENPQSAVQQQAVAGSNVLYMNQFAALNLYIQQIDTRLLVRPRFFTYIRKWMTTNPWGTAIVDPVTGRMGTAMNGDLTEAASDSMTDAYGYDRTNVYYRSGEFIQLNSSTPLGQVYLGYFREPVVAPVERLNDWISTDYPSLIAADVKARTFAVIGKTEEANLASKEIQLELSILQTNNIRVSTKY